MATIKVKFRPSSKAGREGRLYLQVIHHRMVRQVKTDCLLFPHEWDSKLAKIVSAHVDEKRRAYLFSIERELEGDLLKLKRIITRFELQGHPFSVYDILETYQSPWEARGFFGFSDHLIQTMREAGKQRTAETYEAAMKSFRKFYTKRYDIPFEQMDAELMMCYEQYLKVKGLAANTISFYMRNLRAIYNRAVVKELTPPNNPFKYVYTGVDKTRKRAITLRKIQEIKKLDLSEEESMEYARDLFLFSFYTRGMSFVDMAFLKKADLQNGILTYRRHKTGQLLSIKWEMPMQDIVDKYGIPGSPYLLPVIKATGQDEWKQYKSAAHLVNRKLKQVGALLDLPVALTLYVARHAWASIARNLNVALSVISEAMGHDSENTTRIYLASLDTSTVDRANQLILQSL